MAALDSSEVPLREVGSIIEQDVAISAKVLQLVNSAFFGVSQQVTDIRMAVNYLGVDVMKHLVMSIEILRGFQLERPMRGFSLESFETHSRTAMEFAAQLPVAKEVQSLSTSAALLHDTGKLIFAARLPEHFEQAWSACLAEQRPLEEVERELFGTTHAEIGAYLLGLWGLPGSIVDAVARHHRPTVCDPQAPVLDIDSAVQIADALAHERAHQSGHEPPFMRRGLDPVYARFGALPAQ